MKLGGHTNYHGSRTYTPDLPAVASGSWLGRLVGQFKASAKRLFDMLLKPGARDAAGMAWLVHGNERHFSVLGSEPGAKRRRAAESPWPDGEARLRRPLGYRRDSE